MSGIELNVTETIDDIVQKVIEHETGAISKLVKNKDFGGYFDSSDKLNKFLKALLTAIYNKKPEFFIPKRLKNIAMPHSKKIRYNGTLIFLVKLYNNIDRIEKNDLDEICKRSLNNTVCSNALMHFVFDNILFVKPNKYNLLNNTIILNLLLAEQTRKNFLKYFTSKDINTEIKKLISENEINALLEEKDVKRFFKRLTGERTVDINVVKQIFYLIQDQNMYKPNNVYEYELIKNFAADNKLLITDNEINPASKKRKRIMSYTSFINQKKDTLEENILKFSDILSSDNDVNKIFNRIKASTQIKSFFENLIKKISQVNNNDILPFIATLCSGYDNKNHNNSNRISPHILLYTCLKLYYLSLEHNNDTIAIICKNGNRIHKKNPKGLTFYLEELSNPSSPVNNLSNNAIGYLLEADYNKSRTTNIEQHPKKEFLDIFGHALELNIDDKDERLKKQQTKDLFSLLGLPPTSANAMSIFNCLKLRHNYSFNNEAIDSLILQFNEEISANDNVDETLHYNNANSSSSSVALLQSADDYDVSSTTEETSTLNENIIPSRSSILYASSSSFKDNNLLKIAKDDTDDFDADSDRFSEISTSSTRKYFVTDKDIKSVSSNKKARYKR